MESYNSVDAHIVITFRVIMDDQLLVYIRKGFSTIDHLHTLNQIIVKATQYNFPLYMAPLDFEKAFDSLEHHCIFEVLKTSKLEINRQDSLGTYITIVRHYPLFSSHAYWKK